MRHIFTILSVIVLFISCQGTSEINPVLDRLFVEITPDRDSLYFGDDSQVVLKTFEIINNNFRTLEWQLAVSCPWIVKTGFTPDLSGVLSGNKSETIKVEIDRDRLIPGYNSTYIEILTTELDKTSRIKVSAVGQQELPKDKLPILNTLQPDEISSTKVNLQGEIIDPGYPEYSERGFVISKTENPSIGKEDVVTYKSVMDDNNLFSSKISVTPKTDYFVRAYAVNDIGIAYGNDISFTTPDLSTVVVTSAVSNITSSSATFNGKILEAGVPEYSERGFCYTEGPDKSPDIADIKLSVNGSGVGDFFCDIDGLDINGTYNVRAYAIQNGNIVYGEPVTFTTVFESVELSTSKVSNVGYSSATFNGIIINEGIPAYTERGFCYSEQNELPEISDNIVKVEGTGTGSFMCDIVNLKPQTKYYVRAYAVQNGKTLYGEKESFTTAFSKTRISTLQPSVIDIYYAVVRGMITTEGLPPYTERGFCFSQYPNTNPDINDYRIPDAESGIQGEYSCTLSGLLRETNYYVKAYAIQNGEVIYGNTVSFTTVWENADVINLGTSDQNLGSIRLNAEISNQGYPKYSEKGFVYKTMDAMEWYEAGGPELDPTIIDKRVPIVSGTSSTGNYSMLLTGIDKNIVCAFRPYLIQGDEPIYGETEYFLSYTLPEVTTYSIVGDDDDPSRAQLNGLIEWQGTPAYTETGFVLSIEDSMPEYGSTGVAVAESIKNEGAFFATIVTGIPEGITVYIRAYARNSLGISYGKVLTYINK